MPWNHLRLLFFFAAASCVRGQTNLTVRSADGTPIAYIKSGTGPAMLLVHGSASTRTAWYAVLPALSQHFTVYVMDRRGRAPSGDAPNYSLDSETEDVAAVIAAIGEPVTLVGHSYGALIAVRAATLKGRLKNVTRLILYEPPVYVTPRPERAAVLQDVKRAWELNDRDRVTSLFLGEVFGPERLQAARSSPAWHALVATANTIPREMETATKFQVRSEDLKTWGVPTTMLLGALSPPYMREGTEFVCGSIPGCKIVTLEGQGHMATALAPALFVTKVLEAAQ